MIPAPGSMVDTPQGRAAVTGCSRWPCMEASKGDGVSAVTDDGVTVLGRWLVDVWPATEAEAA